MQFARYVAKLGLSDKQVATALGCESITVSRYRRCKRIPEPEMMARIRDWSDGKVTANDFYRSPSAPRGGV